jgi:hypothetical protein
MGQQNRRAMTLDFTQFEFTAATPFTDFNDTAESMYEIFYEILQPVSINEFN